MKRSEEKRGDQSGLLHKVVQLGTYVTLLGFILCITTVFKDSPFKANFNDGSYKITRLQNNLNRRLPMWNHALLI